MSAPLSQRHGEACRFEHMQCMQCRRFECLHSPRWHLCRQPFHQMSCWKLIIFHHGWIYKPLILWACMGNSTLWIKETSTPQGPLIAHTHGHTVTTSSREAIDSVGMCWLQAYLINSMCLPSWHIFFPDSVMVWRILPCKKTEGKRQRQILQLQTFRSAWRHQTVVGRERCSRWVSIGHVKAANQTIEDMKTKLAAKDLEGREAGTFLFITPKSGVKASQLKSSILFDANLCFELCFRTRLKSATPNWSPH